jgi:hypothetical protein
MASNVKMLDYRLLARRCVACGYDGVQLRNGYAARCARCDCDFRRRPARSYAEMEGLVSPSANHHLPIHTLHEPFEPAKLRHRWLAFLFVSMVGVMVMLYLTAEALSV